MTETKVEIAFLDMFNKVSRFRLNNVKQPVDALKVQALADFMVANDPLGKSVVKWTEIKMIEGTQTVLNVQ
ncbi:MULTISPECIES: DUF2922 family protein [Exiguobacterium]|jgi:hypothetical protein|uniref:DUF2922 domain-containing protein n=1 Tax=Exiguobacterium chiriqhucha RW-2 TaxID=1345023 RepID=U1N5K8_9BACL|nr:MULTISPECIES: DUF2922 family protein [Exiguobacterium]ERG67810.1 hypothetical protein M467_11010 [Exiguobacterium chiriqhucha RW-2]KAB2865549.1 MAG: DUF2922 domain-containing protein [Exiguobacterium chiriqhucha]MCT4778446.1 DUF2922 domain-containing protein [Exiguobacterium aquaticum]MCT4790473.1 DUF2922 domain-containing protein [Exiguobacterium mexicanum]TCI70157.1 DUF2922 family protein [Exiguobacterium sp. IPCI3]